MSIQFRPIPLDIFDQKQRPAIARLNSMLHDLCALEGTIKQPRAVKRSDNSISRIGEQQVHVTRITPDIMDVVSGASSIVATPALTFGLTNTVGSTTGVLSVNSAVALFSTVAPTPVDADAAIAGLSATAANLGHKHQARTAAHTGAYSASASSEGTTATLLRSDATFLAPTFLRSSANASTLTLTDDGSQQVVAGSLGGLTINPAAGDNILFLGPPSGSTPSVGVSVLVRPGSAGTVGIQTQYSSAALTNGTVRGWNIAIAHSAGLTSSTIVGYDTTTLSVTPGTGSDSANVIYGSRFNGPSINNNTGGFSEVAAMYLVGARRIVTNPTVTLAAGAIVECPTVSGTSQAGIYIKQRTAQAVATNRYGIFVEANNSGTNRYAFYGVSDILFHAGTVRHTGVLAGLYGATPTVQFGTTGTESGFTAGTSTTVTADSTFTGNTGTRAYTLGDTVRALKLLGVFAY